MSGTPLYIADPNGRWYQPVPRWWNATASAWTTDPLPADPMVYKGSIFDPYIGAGTVLQRDVSDMPLDPQSATYAAWMDANTPYTPGGGFGAKTSLNTSTQNTETIPVYVVDSTAPGATFQYIDSCGGAANAATYLTGRIPWPSGGWAIPAPGGDKSMAIYDLGTGIMREYFYVQAVSGQAGHWTASTGGWSVARPQLEGLAETNYGLQLREGSSAVVAMHNPLGFIGITEALNGRINHAICYTISQAQVGASWPARQADGLYVGTDAPMEGQWCRLPSTVDPMYNPATGLPYNPMTRLIIDAFKTYGAVATDKNLFVHAFNGENGRTWAHLYGKDPWYRHASDGAQDGILTQMYGTTNRSIDVSDFPWHLTEWAPRDWGRPDPDFLLRSGETSVYEPH